MGKIAKSIKFFLTGKYNAGDGNDTIHAYGFGGKIEAFGGNDLIYAGGFYLDIHTGSGNDEVRAGAGSIDVRDTSGNLTVRGASGYTNIYKSASGDIDYIGASGGLNIEHRGAGTIRVSSAALSNVIRQYGSTGDIIFTGAGARNNLLATGQHSNVVFRGAGASNYVGNRSSRGELLFDGAGASNRVERVGTSGRTIFNGAGALNHVTAHYSENFSANRLEFNGAGIGNIVTLSGEAGDLQFKGAGAQNSVTHSARFGDLRFEGAGFGNVVSLSGEHGDLHFTGAGLSNRLSHTARHGDLNFTGAGGYNRLIRIGETGVVRFTGIGAANVIEASFRAKANNRVEFNGAGAANVVTMSGYGSIFFNGAGAANIVTRRAGKGDVYFNGAGLGNVINLSGESGSIFFNGGGGYNVLQHTADRGDIEFNGAGVGNILTRHGKSGSVRFSGVGAANIITAGFSENHASNGIVFNGGGGANVLTLTGQAGNIDFKGVGGVNVLTHTARYGDIVFAGVGGSNILTLTGIKGDIRFKGAGAANILTSTVDHGNIELLGAGAANVLTRTGKTGTATLIGAGLANVVTVNTTEHGLARFYGAGVGNIVTATGGQTDIEMRGIGGANIITNASASGETDVIAVGAGNVVTHTSDGALRAWVGGGANVVTNTGFGHSNIIAVGKLNVVTLADGGSDVVVAGQYNIVTAGAGFDHVLAIGSLNLILAGGAGEGKLDEIVTIGSLSIVDCGAGLQFLSTFVSDPISALKNLSGIAGSAMDAGTDIDQPGPAPQSGAPDLLAMALAEQEAGNIGDTAGFEDISDAELAAAEAEAANRPQDSTALLEQTKIAATSNMAAAEAEEKAAAEAGGTSDTEETMDADLSAQAGGDGTALQSSDASDRYDEVAPGGFDDDQTNTIVWTGLGIGGQWKHGDGVIQIVVGLANITFGSNGSDILVALGRSNFVAGGDGDDLIIAGSPLTAVRNMGSMMSAMADTGRLGNVFDKLVSYERFIPKMLKGDGSLSSKMSGAVALGGAGDDTIVLFSSLNLADAGSGNDTVIAFGLGNFAWKKEAGDLWVGLAGMGNIVVHKGEPTETITRSRLGGLMLGKLNFAYAHDGVDVHGLVMMGEGNVVVKTGRGDVTAGMLGRGNVIVATGNGNDLVVQAGIWGALDGPLPKNSFLKGIAGSVFVREGDGNSAFGQLGDVNVAVKVGNGHMTGVAVGGQSALVNVGDGTVSYLGLSLKKEHASRLVKVGDGDVNVALVSAGSIASIGSSMLNSALSKVGAGPIKKLANLAGLLTGTSVAVQVGDGTFNGLAIGARNVMVRVGGAAGDKTDDPNNFDTLTSKDIDALDVGTKVGDLLSSGLDHIGDFHTRMVAVSAGGSNIMVDVNDHGMEDLPFDWDADRTRARDLIAQQAATTGDAPSRLAFKEFMGTKADGTVVKTSNSLFGAIAIPNASKTSGSGTSNQAANGSAGYDPTKPDGLFAEYAPWHPTQSFVIEHADNSIRSHAASITGGNVLVKVGNGDMTAAAVSIGSFIDAISTMKNALGKTQKTKAYEDKQIDLHINGLDEGVPRSRLEARTAQLLITDFSNSYAWAKEQDAIAVLEKDLLWNPRGYFADGQSHKVYDDARKLAKQQLTDEARREIAGLKAKKSDGSDLSIGGNVIVHVGHGHANMVAAGGTNLMVKAGLGNTTMVALGDKNVMIKMADPITSHDLVEIGRDVQIAVGTGNLIANITGTSNNYIFAVNPNGLQPIVSLFESLKEQLGLTKKTPTEALPGAYSAPTGKTAMQKHMEMTVEITKSMKAINSFIHTGGKGQALLDKASNALTGWKADRKDAIATTTLSSTLESAKQLPFINQGLALKDGVKYLLDKVTSANFIIGGRGSDVIVAVGEFNVIFGDNIADVLDFDIRTLLSARMQSFSGLPFGLTSLIPVGKLDLEIKTFTGDLGDLFGGLVPDPDGLPSIDPEGAVETMKEAWARNLETSFFTNIYMPPVGSMITGALDEIATAFATIGDGDLPTIFDDHQHNLDARQELLAGAFSKTVSRFKAFNFIDFDQLMGADFEALRAAMHKLDYLEGDGDLMVMMGQNNVAFGGHGNDMAVAVSQMSLLTMGDGNDFAVALGNDNRISGDEGSDLILALGWSNLVMGDNGDDLIFGIGSYNRIHGDDGEDIVVGLGSKNLIFGGDGVDLLIGMGDKNLFYSGEGEDIIIGIGALNYYGTGGGSDIIFNLGIGAITEAGSGADYVKLAGLGNAVFGGEDDDTFTTEIDASNNLASGGVGNDILKLGGSGNTFLGDEGDDTFHITTKMLDRNVIGDARIGTFVDGATNATHFETDLIRIDADVTSGDPWTIGEFLNDVWVERKDDDLIIRTRATMEATGLRRLGDVTVTDYFGLGVDREFSGPDIEVVNDDGAIAATLTATSVHDLINQIAALGGSPIDASSILSNGFFAQHSQSSLAARPLSDFV